MTADDLIAFEKQMAEDFESGLIKAPLHLAGGNESHLIRIFEDIDTENDWVCCAWRSHYHCLLKGVPPQKLTKAIHDGRSIALAFPEHKIISSAIVGGIMPIALGLAWAIKQRGGKERVWCFIGDMTACSGIAHETGMYAAGHNLPLRIVVESNGVSVCTNTSDVWCEFEHPLGSDVYYYDLTWPHVGTGRWVSF